MHIIKILATHKQQLTTYLKYASMKPAMELSHCSRWIKTWYEIITCCQLASCHRCHYLHVASLSVATNAIIYLLPTCLLPRCHYLRVASLSVATDAIGNSICCQIASFHRCHYLPVGRLPVATYAISFTSCDLASCHICHYFPIDSCQLPQFPVFRIQHGLQIEN